MEKLSVKVDLDDVMKNEKKHNGSFRLSPHVDLEGLLPDEKNKDNCIEPKVEEKEDEEFTIKKKK